MDLKILNLQLGIYQTNCYILYDENKNAIIIDPGDEAKRVIEEIEKLGLNVEKIIITHAHPDHFGAMDELRKYFNVKAYISAEDEELLKKRSLELKSIIGDFNTGLRADVLLNDGDEIDFANRKIKVISTPGHTPGGICLLVDNILFSGDTLFYGSIGRTDLVGGDFDTLMKSLLKLMELDDDIIVLPGHSYQTTIGFERNNNPFIKRILK